MKSLGVPNEKYPSFPQLKPQQLCTVARHTPSYVCYSTLQEVLFLVHVSEVIMMHFIGHVPGNFTSISPNVAYEIFESLFLYISKDNCINFNKPFVSPSFINEHIQKSTNI